MERNKEYRQIWLDSYNLSEQLAGKVVDKVVFNDKGSHDTQFLIVMFTDKTYIAAGVCYKDLDNKDDEPQLENFYVAEPSIVDGGCFDCHSWIDTKGNLHFHNWIQTLKDLNLWIITEEEAKKIIERKHEQEEEREYKQYLRLKAKHEKKESE